MTGMYIVYPMPRNVEGSDMQRHTIMTVFY